MSRNSTLHKICIYSDKNNGIIYTNILAIVGLKFLLWVRKVSDATNHLNIQIYSALYVHVFSFRSKLTQSFKVSKTNKKLCGLKRQHLCLSASEVLDNLIEKKRSLVERAGCCQMKDTASNFCF